MDISLFNYNLPEYFIAKHPSNPRDNSNLLVFNRETKTIHISKFNNIVSYFKKNDLIVANNVKVIPARVFGFKKTGGKIEILFLKELDNKNKIWEVFLSPSKKLKNEKFLFLNNNSNSINNDLIEILNKKEKNTFLVKVNSNLNIYSFFDKYGHIPLPPYIKRKENASDKEQYQTIFSSDKKKGAIAAPTAGLHFTEKVIDKILEKGIEFIFITLYVNYGTFQPIRVSNIKEHKMHTEEYEISDSVAEKINKAKKDKKNIIAVGTTTVRALESNYIKFKKVTPGRFTTDIFIYPNFKFNVVNKLITNFHLPKSTLLMLVSAFAGRENILKCYEVAKNKNFRFFSYGDCMFII